MLEGHCHPDFAAVARLLRRLIPRRGWGGASVCVYHRGECVVDLWGGTRDADRAPWQRDTIALGYSTTKGVLATLLHVLVDRGLLQYDAPVRRYWPEFGCNGKEEITVRHVLCHEAGLYHIGEMVDHAHRMLDWDHMVEVLAASRPVHPPGEDLGYHGLSWGWLVGELVERVAGAPLREVLANELAGPLGLDGLVLGPGEQDEPRRAQLVEGRITAGRRRALALRGADLIGRGLGLTEAAFDLRALELAFLPAGIDSLDWNDPRIAGALIPSVTGTFTARALARLYAALAGGGALDGVRLVSAATLERAIEVQSRRRGRVIPLAMHWRLGYHGVPALRVRLPHAFGHFGLGGSGAWADPERDLAVALVLNSGMGTPLGDTRIVRIGSVAALAADARTRSGSPRVNRAG